MAETDTTTAPDPQEQYITQMLAQLKAQPPAATGATAQVAKPSSFIGLLGSALGGGPSGSVPMSAEEADAAGTRSLLNFGLNLLANSGYSTERKTIGQLIGGGIGAAQQSLGQSEYMKAARGQAQQDYAAQQQELQIARIKEALPLLNLQDEIQRARRARALLGPSASNTSIGAAGGQTASADVPAELMPHYEAASRETGIPVAVLIAKDKQESGFNNSMPNGGIAQVLPSTAAAPGFGVKPISQAELADPKQNILFGARYLKARGDAAGVKDWNNPDDISKALLAYNGGGDKNYVANVMRYYKPGGAPAAAPAAPSARQPIPATDASGGATAEAAPSPGRAQFAGPGAPPDAVAPPPSPGAAGNADAIAAGMIARGADPTTLAPAGRGVTADEVTSAAAGPAVPSGPVVPAPASPPVAQAMAPEPQPSQPDIRVGNSVIRHPGTLADFSARNYQTAPTTEDFNPNLTDAENAGFAAKRQSIAQDRQSIDTIPRNKVPEAVEAIRQKEAALAVEIQAKIQEKRRTADANLTKWNEKQAEISAKLYPDVVKTYDTALQTNLAGDIASRNSKETADLTSRSKVLDQLNKEAMDSRGAVSELDGLAALSNNVDKPSVFATLKIGDTTVLNRLAQAGIVNADQAGGTQLLQSGISNAVARLRSGMSMGTLSDRDLGFIENMAPNMYENKQTRAAVISYLRRAQDQKGRFNIEVNKLVADGKPISEALQTAADTIEQKYPIVPARSQELGDHWLDPDPFWKKKRQDWATEHNIRPGTMFRRADGGLEVIYSPGMQPVRQAIDVGGTR